MKVHCVVLYLTSCLLTMALGYDILCLSPMPSRSHHNIGRGAVKALLKAGHQVTWATPYPEKDTQNLTYIDLSDLIPIIEDYDFTKVGVEHNFTMMLEMTDAIYKRFYMNKQLQHALVTKQFDAVVTEWFMSNVPAGFAAVQQVPWILLNSVAYNLFLELLVDEVRSLNTLPLLTTDWRVPMSIYQRAGNVAMAAATTYMLHNPTKEAQEYEATFAPLAAARGVSLPPYSDAIYNISILFVNSHPSFSYAQSLPPNVQEVGGYHIDEEVEALPEDLQTLLDSSPEGVVYFSMGSVVQPKNFPLEEIKMLIAAFRALPQIVLWKFDATLLEGLDIPSNVHIRKWMPQASILAHKNLQLFITHGGLLSTLEAMHFGKPLLSVPMFGDQMANAGRAEQLGFALRANFEPNLAANIIEKLPLMLHNNTFAARAQELSAIFRNRVVSPRELIAHYVEVAIETKGAYHLRSVSRFYRWYERAMLDVLCVVALGMLVALYVVKLILTTLFRRCCHTHKIKTN